MLNIKVLASGSTGNAYIVSDGVTTLLLEAGISSKQIAKQAPLSLIDACLISHEHGDHAKAAADLVRKYSIDLYASQGTLNAIRLNTDYRCHLIKSESQITIGTFAVTPFNVKHDAAEPLGFIISSSAGKLLFVTDTYLIPYKIPKGTTVLMLECNYSLAELEKSIALGVTDHRQRDRLRLSHMSLEYLINGYLQENRDRLSTVQEIHLIHVSDRNGNRTLFKQAVEDTTGLPVTVH